MRPNLAFWFQLDVVSIFGFLLKRSQNHSTGRSKHAAYAALDTVKLPTQVLNAGTLVLIRQNLVFARSQTLRKNYQDLSHCFLLAHG